MISHGVEETWEIAAGLVRALPPRAVICLHGELGSGKTCFVQGMAFAMGIGRPVTSPTFTLVREYAGERPLVHLDLYRLNSPEEVAAVGFETYVAAEAITAVEWADRAGDLLPPDAVHVYLAATDDPIHRWRIERIDALVDYVQLWREMPPAFPQVREGRKVDRCAKDASLAWLRRLHAFAEAHRKLNDGIFDHNPAEFMMKGWVEKV